MTRWDGWWADDPIGSTEDEALGRGPFVEQAVAMLNLVGNRPSSSVIALVGPWGSGKTSTANLIIAGLDSTAWGGVGRLLPWALSTADAIVGELLGAIAGALPPDRKSTRALRRLKDYARTYAVPALSLVPTVGSAAEKVAEHLLAADNGTLQARFEQVGEALDELARPVLIFVDDVDRLQPDELLTLFRAIRVVGRFPYVHYLIAYDQRTIVDLLKATSVAADREDRALAFLEKVVTLPIDQPAIREAQSAELFNDGLAALLRDLGISVAEEQRRRLTGEWEELLAADLSEPRGIRRLLAQLRVHLPLAGPQDVDLADFVVMTHLRVAYPRLYQALRADRAWLASGGPRVEGQLKRWQEVTDLTKLAVAEDRGEAVLATLRRLFPVLGGGPEMNPRHQGVDNQDYTARYFTFVPEEAEPSDAELMEWSRGPLLEAVLRPDKVDRWATDRSAAILRRLANLAGQLDPAQAEALLRFVVPYLPLPPGANQLLGGPDAAMSRLLAALLKHVGNAQFSAVLARAASEGIGALAAFVEAVPSDSRFVREAGDHAWTSFLNNAKHGDMAPAGPTEILFGQADRLLGSEELNWRLADVVDNRTDLGALAARLVDRGYSADSAPEIVGFDAEALIERLGSERVSRHLPDAGSVPQSPDPNGWRACRFHAIMELAAALQRITGASVQVPRPFTSHRVEVLNAPNGEIPDLKVSVTALVPAADVLPSGTAIAEGPAGQAREDLVQRQLVECALTRWLRREPDPRWPFRFGGWQIADPGDGTRYTGFSALLHDTSGRARGWRQETPVLAGVNIRTGAEAGEGFLVAHFAVGLWLTELDDNRRPADRRHDARPLPAALTPPELYALLVAAMVTALDVSVRLHQELLRQAAPNPDVIVRLTAESSNGLDTVVDLTGLNRVGTGTGSAQHADDFLFRPGREALKPAAREWAGRFLNDWLMRSGYRGYEATLAEIRETAAERTAERARGSTPINRR